MKIILLMSISADGYISRDNDDAPWSAEEFARCKDFVKSAGNFIVGRRTYELMKAAGDFDESVNTLVLSSQSQPSIGNVHFFTSAAEAIESLKFTSAQSAVLGGGEGVNSTFLDANLVDEIILDVEPLVIGKGFHIFKERDRDLKLQLISTEKLDENTVRLHYSVQK